MKTILRIQKLKFMNIKNFNGKQEVQIRDFVVYKTQKNQLQKISGFKMFMTSTVVIIMLLVSVLKGTAHMFTKTMKKQ